MRRVAVALGVVVLLCAGGGQASAEVIPAGVVLVDFEEFDDGDNLNGANLCGVTLTVPNGLVEVFNDRFGVYYHSATKAIASPSGLLATNPLVGVFDSPVNYVGLWGGDAGTYVEADSWELLAYDAPSGGNLVGRASSGSWNGKPYCQLVVTAQKICRFEAVWTGKVYGIGYDDLSFAFIPEPTMMALTVVPLVWLAAIRRARRAR